MLTYQREHFASLILELLPLFHQHWLELGSDHEKIPLAPAYNRYLDDDRNDRLLIVTVRDGKKLVGYFFGFAYFPYHYETTKYGMSDMFFIYKEYMQDMAAGPRLKKLFVTAENLMRDNGVKRLYISFKAKHPLAPILRRLGYRPCDEVHCKLL